jgi:hypothetical protein
MRVYLSRDGLHVIFRMGDMNGRTAIGFKVKPASRMVFSERYGFRRGVRIGPIWFGTYAKTKAYREQYP